METKSLENLLSRSQVSIIKLNPEPDRTSPRYFFPTIYIYLFPVASFSQVSD
jgi:hypothetical protein